jgi:hypothetical protein
MDPSEAHSATCPGRSSGDLFACSSHGSPRIGGGGTMIGVKSYGEKAIAAVERNQSAVERSTKRLADHLTAKPDADDADALFAWKRELRDFEDRADSDKEALAFAVQRADEARRADAVRAADAEHAAVAKIVPTHSKLTLEIAADAEKLAAKLKRLEEMRATIDAANAVREGRAYLSDGEFQVRQIPGEFHPAITREDDVWVDRDGNPVSDQILDDQNRWVANPKAVGKGVVTTVLRAAQQLPPRMPERLADALHLVNLGGEQLWPPR